MSSAAHGTTPYYYVPHESRHPVMAAIGLFFLILGAGQWIKKNKPMAAITGWRPLACSS